ncbi:hypothetical protein J2S00_003303 [Caldalkalibacillus uzonensis]|uniref:Uncharacterized protein n=1 Tax=Caldalkalibacillus uzonensis TaxID=353224 RepID=A0ABU0CWK2_9BACI|nr:hypothetical protein [Caldalkalibacillus uzonensis]MDQ0340488.1 hypothetical protein [Caldalkalibacillus uzonensis]
MISFLLILIAGVPFYLLLNPPQLSPAKKPAPLTINEMYHLNISYVESGESK